MLCVYIQNCASYQGREHIFRKIMQQSAWNVENGAGRPYVANVMGICGGLVEPKSVQVGPWAIIVHQSPASVQILKSPCKSKTRTCCICIDMKIENVLPAAVGSMILKITYSRQFPPSTAFFAQMLHWLQFKQSDRAENHNQNDLYLGRFEVEKVRVLI